MPTFFNISNRKGVFMIPAGATKSPTPAPPSFSNTKSLAFDGVDEYVSLGTPSFLNATSEFTSSLWFNTNDVGTQTTLWAIGSSASQLWVISKIQDDLIIYGGTSTKYYRKNNLFSINTWYNLIVVYDGSQANADRFKAYLNGVLLTGATINGTIETITPTFTTDFNIGRIGYAAASYFNGNIDEVALWNTTLTPSEISTIATAPSDLSSYNPLAWYRCGDNSTYQTPQILMPENTNKDKVSNWSLQFNGVDDYVNCGVISDFVSSSAFSVSGWFYFDSVANHKTLFSYGLSTGSQYCWTVQTFPAGELIFVIADALGDSGNNYIGTNLSSPLVTEQWYHICVVYDGSGVGNTDKAKIYINGTEATYSGGGGTIPATTTASTGSFNIGRWDLGGSDRFFTGTIDEVSVYSSALTPEQITSIFNGGEPTTISGSTAYWKLGEQSKFTDNWLVPNSALSNYSKYSFNLDGVDDYVDLGTSIDLGTNSTISFWFKSSTGNTNHTLIGENTYSFDYLLQLASGTNTSYIRIGSVVKPFTTTELNDGNWNHWCIVRSGDSIELFINNVSKGTQTGYGTGTNTLFNVIGAEGDYQFPINGSLDEFAVWDSVQDVSSIYNGGEPTTISGAVAHWRMGEDATYNSSTSQWTIPDQVGSNDGTSSNTMALNTLVGDAPNYFGGGLSDAMTIEDRVGDAPNSSNNSVSFNMEAEDINNNVPT